MSSGLQDWVAEALPRERCVGGVGSHPLVFKQGPASTSHPSGATAPAGGLSPKRRCLQLSRVTDVTLKTSEVLAPTGFNQPVTLSPEGRK